MTLEIGCYMRNLLPIWTVPNWRFLIPARTDADTQTQTHTHNRTKNVSTAVVSAAGFVLSGSALHDDLSQRNGGGMLQAAELYSELRQKLPSQAYEIYKKKKKERNIHVEAEL